MLDRNDIEIIREIVQEIVRDSISPLRTDIRGLQNDVLRLDGKIDALARVTDRRFDEVLATFNAYATVTDRRLLRLETHVGLV